MSNILKVNAAENELKAYFEAVCRIIDEKRDEFPVNLDDVWSLVYPRKDHAVRDLTAQFIQDVDYKVFPKNGENPIGGRPANEYHISISCMEFLIARKKREVFEVYRQVFHAARRGELHATPLSKAQRTLATIQQLCELAQRDVELEQRQIEIEKEQKALAGKMAQIEDIVKPNGFMSVMGFANIHHLNIGKKAAQSIGRLASKWCKCNGRNPEKTNHERWGEVNTYPMEALKCCFAEFYPDRHFD